MSGKVEAYYDQNAAYEWNRLERHRIEFALTMRALRRHLPAGGRVLDVGGGPGRYSIALAQEGYAPTLFDLSQGNLDLARQLAAEQGVTLGGFVHGDARDLSAFADASYDAVLLFGPLYHLLDEGDRARCVQEALRVLRPGGVLAVSIITRYAFLRDFAIGDPGRVLQILPRVQMMLETGVAEAPADSVFTDHYSFLPAQLQPWMERFGLRTMDLLGQEGLLFMVDQEVNQLQGEAWEAWVDLNDKVARDPSTWGGCGHMLWIGTK